MADIGSELRTVTRVVVLAGTLFLGGLAVGYYTSEPSRSDPVDLTPISTVAATVVTEPTKTALAVPTPVTAPTVESFKETNYIWAMRFMDQTFGRIAQYYDQKDPLELTGVGIALMLTETDANTKNWLQIEEATEREALADLRKRMGDEAYLELMTKKSEEEQKLIAASAKVGKDYQTVTSLTKPGELAQMRRMLMYYSYNGGSPLTQQLWKDWQQIPGDKKDNTWVGFSDFVKKRYPLWGTDVNVYRNRAEQLYWYAIQTHYDFLRGNPPSEQAVQEYRHKVFLVAPARKR